MNRRARIHGIVIALVATMAQATATTLATDAGVIAYGRHLDPGAAIDLINPDGSGLQQVPNAGLIEDFGIPSWSPDSTRLLISNALVLDENGECCFAFRPAIVEPDGDNYNLLEMPEAPMDMYCRGWTADGQRILCGIGGDSPGAFSVRASDGGDARRLTTNPWGSGDVPWSISPDGSEFAFIRYRPGPMPERNPFITQHAGIFIASIDGSNVRQVVAFGFAQAHELASASWSPDGKRILAATKHGRLFTVDTDGSSLKLLKLAVTGDYFAYQPDWSPSGDRIVFGMFQGNPDLYVANADGSNVVRLTDNPDFEDGPDWGSPAG
jgi:Tol biopolymer transport system component